MGNGVSEIPGKTPTFPLGPRKRASFGPWAPLHLRAQREPVSRLSTSPCIQSCVRLRPRQPRTSTSDRRAHGNHLHVQQPREHPRASRTRPRECPSSTRRASPVRQRPNLLINHTCSSVVINGQLSPPGDRLVYYLSSAHTRLHAPVPVCSPLVPTPERRTQADPTHQPPFPSDRNSGTAAEAWEAGGQKYVLDSFISKPDENAKCCPGLHCPFLPAYRRRKGPWSHRRR